MARLNPVLLGKNVAFWRHSWQIVLGIVALWDEHSANRCLLRQIFPGVNEEHIMREVAIVSPVRTAVGNFGGGLKDIPAAELGATVIKAVLERTGLDPSKIDEVILGH